MTESENSKESSVGGITIECIDYSGQFASLDYELQEQTEKLADVQYQLAEVREQLSVANEYQMYTCGFLLFGVVCVICLFAYKFFRMFI